MGSHFHELDYLFATPSLPKNIQSYQIIKSFLSSLSQYTDQSVVEQIALDLAESVYKFKTVVRLERAQILNGEEFIKTYVKTITDNEVWNLTAQPWSIQGLPEELQNGFTLQPLAGTNTAWMKPTNTEIQSGGRRWILLWYTSHPQRTDACVFILDIITNKIYGLPTYKKWFFDDLLWIFRSVLEIEAWTNAGIRQLYFTNVEPATTLALATSNIPIHFGHYLQNDIAHLSRLEEIGVTDMVDRIYRSQLFDYFTPEEEMLFFSQPTRAKALYMDSREAIQASAKREGVGLVLSKGSTFGKQLSKQFRESLRNDSGVVRMPDDWMQGTHSSVRICVGIRGGSRMALNLKEAVAALISRIHKTTGKSVHLVIDGMSRSALNHHDTTRLLSTDHEIQIADEFIRLSETTDYCTATSVVNMKQAQQLKAIATCHLALSGYGTSTFKYMYLCSVPTVVHGERAPYDYLNAGEPPSSVFLGLDCVSSIEKIDDPKRSNYMIDIVKFCERTMEYVTTNGYLENIAGIPT